MKKLLFLLVIMFSFGVSNVQGMVMDKEEIVIVEKGNEENNASDRPRTATFVPLECYYDNGVVSLELLANLGEVQLTVTNQATGEQWRTEINWVLQTSTANGVYLVEIIIEDGTIYWGTYTL